MSRHTVLKRIFLYAVLLLWTAAIPVAEALTLRLELAEAKEVSGPFSVVLFDSGLGNGIQRVAVLDRDGDGFRFEPYAPEFEYKIIRGLSGQDALRRAQEFLAVTPDIWKHQLSRITGTAGAVIGYEVRPLYQRPAFGTDDVLEISYRVQGEAVFIHMRLIEAVERLFRSSGGEHE
ncbi:MAG TPA: hypothetical protein VLH56_04985 [Dissulfurispiraceae bacterium]|nr:hypothetical protein [Dissulfurispiraceae bacterium]